MTVTSALLEDSRAVRVEAKASAPQVTGHARDYWQLLKPRVMALVLFTGIVGMVMAPGHVHPWIAFVGVVCIALGAGASGAINMGYEADLDAAMLRTRRRPTVQGKIHPRDAIVFGGWLAAATVGVMMLTVNVVAGALLALSVAIYVGVYTLWLKRRSPQNIVIGGAAGALPPMIGWAVITGDVSWTSFWLFLLIFLWTPPHFWALSLTRREEYAQAGVPMLSVTAGEASTKRSILLYALSLLPCVGALICSTDLSTSTDVILLLATLHFIGACWRLQRAVGIVDAPRVFGQSILYLFLVYAALLFDSLLRGIAGMAA